MSAADQRKVVLQLRLPPPAGMDRWTPSAIARQAGLSILEANIAIRSLRNSGKIKFGALELSASMLEDQQNSRSDARPSRLDDLGSVQDGRDKCPRTGSAGTRLVGVSAPSPSPLVGEGGDPLASASGEGEGDSAAKVSAYTDLPPIPDADDAFAVEPVLAAPPHPSAAAPLPPSPTRGEGEESQSATDSFAPPGQGAVAAAGGTPPATGHCRPGLVAADASLGEELLGEIEIYLARTRMGASLFGDLAVSHPGYVNLCRMRKTARPKTAEPVRAFMARWPQGATRDQVREWNHDVAEDLNAAIQMASVAAAPGLLSAAVKAEALAMGARRQAARCTGTVANPLSANVVSLQAAMLAEPEDAFLFLRRRWPRLLRDVIALSRLEEKTPAAALAAIIDAGIDATVARRAEAEKAA